MHSSHGIGSRPAHDSGVEAAELLRRALACAAIACRQAEQSAALAPDLPLADADALGSLVIAALPTNAARVSPPPVPPTPFALLSRRVERSRAGGC